MPPSWRARGVRSSRRWRHRSVRRCGSWISGREATLRARIRQRGGDGHDASEANLAVLDHQLRGQEPLTRDEQALTLHWDTECPGEAAPVAAKLERLAPHPAHSLTRGPG